MKGFELEWEHDRFEGWKGSLTNWPGGRTTMALIRPLPDRGEEGIYRLTAALLSDEKDGEEGTLDQLKEIAQAGLDQGLAHAANLYHAHGHPIRPEAMSWQELLPKLFEGGSRLTMAQVLEKLESMGAAEGYLDGMLEDLELQPRVVEGEDDEGIYYTRLQFGAELIAAERDRHISEEGFTAEVDDQYFAADLAEAALCYTEAARSQVNGGCGWACVPDNWPWIDEWWKPSSDPVRNLVKAGALIAAEIDRLQRKGAA